MQHETTDRRTIGKHYATFALNLLLSLVIMYFVMFVMIWSLDDFFHNLNMFYMAVMMVTPMGALMLLMMGSMYPNRALNLALYAAFALLFVLSFLAIRDQTLVGDRQFLRSMIPHHSGAILMCREASITNPDIQALCDEIIGSQKREIDQMKAIMARL